MTETEGSNKAKGGHARAESLTAEERKDIARRAALVRWQDQVPQATHEGTFPIGPATISAAVLPNGQRLLTQATFLRALGRARSPKAGTGVLKTVDGTPFFLQATALKPFISEELLASTTPVFFREKSGARSVGYDAQLLPKVADVYLKYRDALVAAKKPIPRQYEHIITACDLLLRGLAHVGIVALVDEATGYQEVRDRLALQRILDAYLSRELAAWAKRFPDEFYKEMFRLRNWKWDDLKKGKGQGPRVVGKYTNDLVYSRLAPGILEDLQRRNPTDERGRRRSKHHQWLTDDVGHPALAQHLHAVTGFMRASETWDQFLRLVNRAFPRRTDLKDLPLFAGALPDAP